MINWLLKSVVGKYAKPKKTIKQHTQQYSKFETQMDDVCSMYLKSGSVALTCSLESLWNFCLQPYQKNCFFYFFGVFFAEYCHRQPKF